MSQNPKPASYELVGHRGYPSKYPENTRLGFEKAIEAGALRIEADLQMSADGVPVIFHDHTLDRLCGCSGVVYRTQKQDLDKLSPYYPARFGTRFKGVRFMDLEDMVQLLLRHDQVVLYLEIKRSCTKAHKVDAVLNAVLQALEPVRSRVVLISFSLLILKAAKAKGWERLGPVISRWGDMSRKTLINLDPEVVFINYRRLPLGVHFEHPHMDLAFYEISDSKFAQNLAEKGARFIETDAVGEMISGQL